MNPLLLALSAILAVALTPMTLRVVSRAQAGSRWLAVPLAIVVALAVGFASNRLFDLTLGFVVGVAFVSAVLATQIVIDICVRRLLRALSYGGLVVFVICAAFTDPMEAQGLRGLLIGALVMTAVAALLVFVSRGALGLGDLHLSPLLGALIGWFAPSGVVIAWLVTAIAGALVTSIGLATKRLSKGSMIPYGPFMVFGTMVAITASAARI